MKAGRVVGALTALLAVLGLLGTQSSFYAATDPLLRAAGVGGDRPAWALFWSNVALTALARYSVCYVVGSLLGVVYEWLDRPSLPVLVAMVTVVGVGDAALAYLDTFDAVLAGAYVLAWWTYVPVFRSLFDDDAEAPSGPRRLGESE